jgi:hypothetical protein
MKRVHEVKSRVDEEALHRVKEERNILDGMEGEVLNILVIFCVETAI